MFPIEVANFKKMYGECVGVEDVSFNIKAGEVFGFIGPNGSGKSTTIRALMGLIKPTSGLVNMMGYDCFKQGELARENVGYLPSEVFLYPKMTVKEFLEFIATQKGVGGERIHELSNKFELNLNRKTDELSLGNKKKVGIVSALLASPKILVLDEPTTGLDPIMQQRFFEVIDEEKKRGISVLLSSHILTDIQRICDRAGIIKQGKIIAIKEVSSLKQKLIKNIKFETEYSNPPITLDGVEDLVVQGKLYSFHYNGAMKPLVDFLSSIDVRNLSIEDVNLDEEFIHYYE